MAQLDEFDEGTSIHKGFFNNLIIAFENQNLFCIATL